MGKNTIKCPKCNDSGTYLDPNGRTAGDCPICRPYPQKIMKRPIDKLFDTVQWVRLSPIVLTGGYVPYATHSGILHVGELEFKVYQLSNGQRVIAEEDMIKFFDGFS